MPDIDRKRLLDIPRRTGHFALESGLHAEEWLELDSLFCEPRRIDAAVAALANHVASRNCEGICGPLVGGALLAQRIAMELDVPMFFTVRSGVSPEGELYGARYELPVDQQSLIRNRSVALVDDAISGGSATLASMQALRHAHATVATVACLLQLGDVGAGRLESAGAPIYSVARRPLVSWLPDECPMCRRGVPLSIK